jgi:RHS repeat-associated protein
VQTNEVYYVYDGNLVIQERDINNLPTVTYTRGKDLSGGLEGAGGIGGLLARTAQAYVDAPLAGHSFYHSDANGNITMLIDSSQGIVAKYLYDAFGNTISASGLLANANVYRFSSKEWHQNSGLSYYLYRYYDPNLQRWLNRDPIGEAGGINLYQAMRNNPLRWVDPFGLTTYVWPPENTPPGTYGPTATVVNDGSDAVLPAIPYLTDSQGLGSTDLDFLPFFLPEIPAVSKALDAVGDALGNAAKGALDKMGLGKPKPPVKCPPPKPPGWKPDWEKGISSRSNGPKGKPGGESWWPPEGGEWHFHDTDPWHPDAHWDYNPWDSYVSPWQNIDQQGNVIPKK